MEIKNPKYLIMRKTFTYTILFLFVSSFMLFSQEPLNHEKRIFRGENNRLYLNKDLPVYVRIASSPDDNAGSWLLFSETSKNYTNPMYLDAEGWNSLRSPSAVDTATKKLVMPVQDIVFEIYTDGIAPVSQHQFTGSQAFVLNKIKHFGKDLNIEISARDENSGMDKTYFSLNKSPWTVYTDPIEIKEQGDYELQYYSVDMVGNVEKIQSERFVVDFTPPVSSHRVDGMNKDNVVAKNASIILESKDEMSGVNKIYYSIDDGDDKVYTRPIPVSVFRDGEAKLSYYAVDNVGNQEVAKSIGTFSSSQSGDGQGDNPVFDFYIDRLPPEVSLEMVGDSYEANNLLYISERSKVKLNATDDKSGVQAVYYSYNAFLTKEEYSEPFTPSMKGAIKLSYNGIDYVDNVSEVKTRNLFLDHTFPLTQIRFEGPRFTNRDTLFISSKTKVVLDAKDSGSGVKNIHYTLNSEGKNVFSSPFSIEKQGIHSINYFANDHVNNEEAEKTQVVYVDNDPPVIHFHFSVEQIGEKTLRDETFPIYPSNAKLYIAATDNLSGGEKLEYSINGAARRSVIPVEKLVPGNYEVEIFASDALGNSSSRLIKFAIEK